MKIVGVKTNALTNVTGSNESAVDYVYSYSRISKSSCCLYNIN